jgi:hypothetical protein
MAEFLPRQQLLLLLWTTPPPPNPKLNNSWNSFCNRFFVIQIPLWVIASVLFTGD